MGEVSLETLAYAKMILHAVKYPHCAVTGVLIANAPPKDGANQDLEIVDAVPLFHHSHYVSPMAEFALAQIETVVEAEDRIIAGYYAACENFRDNTVEKCPGRKIADKIAEYCPSAVFVVIDNRELVKFLTSAAIKIHKFHEGKWKQKDDNQVIFQSHYVLQTVSHLIQSRVYKDLVDFDNYLDDVSQDWTNKGIGILMSTLSHETAVEDEEEE